MPSSNSFRLFAGTSHTETLEEQIVKSLELS